MSTSISHFFRKLIFTSIILEKISKYNDFAAFGVNVMHFIGFICHVFSMMVCIAGLCLFTVRREHCQKKFALCIAVTIALESVVYHFILIESAGVKGISVSKILTTIMISLQIFWGGLYSACTFPEHSA